MPLPTDRPIGDHEPLRLLDAARLMFPDGSVGERALRRLRDRGQLDCSRVGGADYTTLAAMRVMLERTRVPPKTGQRVEVRRVAAASDEPGSALAALLAKLDRREPEPGSSLAAALAKVRDMTPPAQPQGKQARQPLPEPLRPKTQKRQLSLRVPKVPASKP